MATDLTPAQLGSRPIPVMAWSGPPISEGFAAKQRRGRKGRGTIDVRVRAGFLVAVALPQREHRLYIPNHLDVDMRFQWGSSCLVHISWPESPGAQRSDALDHRRQLPSSWSIPQRPGGSHRRDCRCLIPVVAHESVIQEPMPPLSCVSGPGWPIVDGPVSGDS
jgi:hypothetical protein